MAQTGPAKPVLHRPASLPPRTPDDKLALIAFAVGAVGLIIAAASLAYAVVEIPAVQGQLTPPTPGTIYQNVVAGVYGSSSSGYAGYDNFSTPGSQPNLAEVKFSIEMSIDCDKNRTCEVYLGPTGALGPSLGELFLIGAPGNTTVTEVTTLPTGQTEIVVLAYASTLFVSAIPFQAHVSIEDYGFVALR